MKSLLLKLFRDIKSSIGGFVSIMFVIGIGAAFFSGLLNSSKSVDNLISTYYENQNFSDYVAYFRGISSEDLEFLNSNKDIDDFELRYSFDTNVNVGNSENELRVHTLTKNINQPYLYEGNFPNVNEIILDRSFAFLNNLKIGDVVSFVHNSMDFNLKVSGIMDSPEYVYKVKDSFSGNVDFEGFGVGYINEETLRLKFKETNIPFLYSDVIIKSDSDLKELSLFDGIETFLGMIRRDENISFKSFEGALNQIEKVVVIFPIIFFLVAGIITFISMSKNVENQRTQIGIMGALGFSTKMIYLNYILYSCIGSLVGSLVGGFLGIYTIPKIILKTFSAQYVFPMFKLKLFIEFILYGCIISVIFSVVSTIISCNKTLKECPANALRPKQPKRSSHIFIEKFKMWKKISFTKKIIIRNIIYNRARLILSSIGIMGSIAFLITGFSLKSSVDELLDYEVRTRKYNFEIRSLVPLTEQDVLNYNENIEDVDLRFNTFGKFYDDKRNKSDIPIVIYKNGNDLLAVENDKKEIIDFGEDGVIVPHIFKDKYGFNVGDKIDLEISLNGNEIKLSPTIKEFGNMYSSQMIYISENLIKDNGLSDVSFTSALVKLKDGADTEQVLSDLKNISDIEGITLAKDVHDFAKNITSMISSIVMIIIIGSGILAISVIYNITSINIFERIREISTLLVLGYYDNEINKLIFTENFWLTLFGGILGMPFGIYLFKYMNTLISDRGANLPDFIFVKDIVFSFIMILIFSSVTNILLRKKVLKINMVEALKGIE